MSKYKFSGHETFQCRFFWLKKGFDYIKQGKDFKSTDALIDLGVGKNMVSSINHWMKAFSLIDVETGGITEFGKNLFDDVGFDPYLEDVGSLFLLHYNIVRQKETASLYEIAFIDFRRTRIDSEFTTEILFEYLTRKLRSERIDFSDKTLRNDIRVFIKTYQASLRKGSKSLEDDFSSILIDLKYLEPIHETFINGEQVFRMNYGLQKDLDELVLLFAILDTFPDSNSIAIEEIQSKVSDVFLLNREGTEEKLNRLNDRKMVVYKVDAGRKEIQLKSDLNKWDVLKRYYGRI